VPRDAEVLDLPQVASDGRRQIGWAASIDRLLKNSLSLRLLKKVQMQGGTPQPE
jgi:hypothetical protein